MSNPFFIVFKPLFILLVVLCAGLPVCWGQDKWAMPTESPLSVQRQNFSTSYIEVSYSRPSVKGRRIFGDYLRYGEIWRAGANEATRLHFGEEVFFAGKKIPAGKYALYIIPDAKEWTIILNEGLNNWGLSGYAQSQDVLRVKVPVYHAKRFMETLLISVEDISMNTCNIRIGWEHSEIFVPIRVENQSRIDEVVRKMAASERPPYVMIARYYMRVNRDLDTALSYVNRALETDTASFSKLALKAQILLKLNQKEEAVKEAKRSWNNAKGTPYEHEYEVRYNDIVRAARPGPMPK